MKTIKYILTSYLLFSSLSLFPQEINSPEGFGMKTEKMVEVSPVKNQDRTGTCWSFATTSFLESEILREAGEVVDLSEMFFAYHAYLYKAENYTRFHGLTNFGQGGQAHDVLNVIKDHGLVTEKAYEGEKIDGIYNHAELSENLSALLKAITKSKGEKISDSWDEAYQGVLDAYMGKIPDTIMYRKKAVTPLEMVEKFQLQPENYVELTSFTHQPFYKPFVLEVPDNWSFDLYYNLPLDELISVIDHALINGYSIAWDGDVSSTGFSHENGLAMVLPGNIDKKKPATLFLSPVNEPLIDQETRQNKFDNYTTTDDHLMHVVGIAHDKDGTKYYITKNSWGENSNNFGGYLFMSEAFMRLNTIAVMVNKKALPSKTEENLKMTAN